MYQRQLQTLINYSNIHIHDYIHKKTDLTDIEKEQKIQIIFKLFINEIRTIATSCNEIDRFNTPMGFLFQHLKPTIIKLIANSFPQNDKIILESGICKSTKQIQFTVDYNILIFNKLLQLQAKDTFLWFLFQIPYYNDYDTHNNNINYSNNNNHIKYNTDVSNIFLNIPETDSPVDKYRYNYMETLAYVMNHWDTANNFTESEFIFASNETCMPYASAYHNRPNKDLLSKYCQFLRKICPWLNYYSPNLAVQFFKSRKTFSNHQEYENTPQTISNQHENIPAPISINGDFTHFSQFDENALQKGEKQVNITEDRSPLDTLHAPTRSKNGKNCKIINIAFISDSMAQDTSVLRDRISIIGKLDRTKYNVYFASFIPFEKIIGNIAKVFMNRIKSQSHYIWLGTNISSARLELEKYNLDIIIYPDLGMKLLPTLLAYSRIAPIQITTWGHSDTSGIDTIDYYISSKLFKCDTSSIILDIDYVNNYKDTNNHSENVIFMQSLGTYYISPHKLFIENDNKYSTGEKRFKTRGELGFTSKQTLYGCLQTFYKFGEQFEYTLSKILELDPNGIILLSNAFPFCKSHLARIKNIFGDEKLQRLRWYGSLEKDQFLNLISICDVCLDPFPFGGCNTSYDAFDYNIPVITYPSKFLSGRFTLGLYKQMGLNECECIATNCLEYSHLASNMGVGINDKLRHKMNRNIEMYKHKIFQDNESVNEWNQILFDLYEKNKTANIFS